MDKVIVIMGPTASGKTKLSIELAKKLNGEIISADSMQIYKDMDIGTAKPSEEEMEGIRHYMIDEVTPGEEFSVVSFQKRALKYIDLIIKQGKLPIVAGGTGLYINSLVHNLNFSETSSDWEFRERLKKEAQEKGNTYLHEKLREIDPVAAENIHENNVKRVIRAIEVYEYTKRPISKLQEESKINPPKYEFVKIGLAMQREKLYCRINKRVDKMFGMGLVEEVRNLIAMGYDRKSVAMQGLGYKEILAYFRGEATLDEAINVIKRDTRRYAKRQMTWFKKNDNVLWIDPEKFEDKCKMLEYLKYHIETYGII